MCNTALITGASSGIGKEFARIHAKNGGDLVIVARNENKLNELKVELEQKYKVTVLVIKKDLTEKNACNEVYNKVISSGIRVNILINNAGFGGLGKFNERRLEDDMSMIDLNISALTKMTHLFLNDFIKYNEGRILNVSSTASLMPGPLQAVYFATKAYVRSFTNAIAEELHDTNITVTNLMPGATESDFGKTSGMDKTSAFESPADAKSVALDGYNAMMNGDLDVITGLPFAMKVITKLLPFIPKKVLLKQVRKMQDVS
ncbi:SDR family oxidoreductase [Cellulophaga sp. HaHaR_3_176]|uniref:SDR family NAD(P)-dependent oxidoreductase n=1 Tax=Cellulophaga sp. HaHaR_3_176 TaxID=1942464 RepID=UPI001C1FCB00|nr:SDR family oxidoreductase [Cellulophaga sp. HaHaR_3_176]QWX85298.1 SDR family oxidoreductase [Cellulophaga sp. HaHaR_3_176]